MPVVLPKGIPAQEKLISENIFVMTQERARAQDIRPLRILVLNLMPTKVATETQIARLVANSPLQVELSFLLTKSYTPTHISQEHLKAFYITIDEVKDRCYDGFIITGAPVETLEFHEVEYWSELEEIFEWSKTHVYSTLHICWGAQAALWHHFGIGKIQLPKKLSGIYRHRVTRPNNPMVRGFDEGFLAPHSRNTGIDAAGLTACPLLRILAESPEAGPFLLSTENGRQIFVTGHPEYDRMTLDGEYRRDLARGINPEIPVNYYPDDDPEKPPVFRWRAHAHLLYHNWLNYYVYQETPYDLKKLASLG